MGTKKCKKCEIEKELCEFNKDKYSKDGHRYRCRQCTSLEYKNYYYNNHNYEIQRQVNYQKKNKEKVNLNRNKREANKRNTDILYKIQILLRNRLKHYLKLKNISYKPNKSKEFVGCTPDELRIHLENQFKDGMNWDNYGFYGWHIDHIIPISKANSIEEMFKLAHYTNLQPLWANENYKKGDKLL